jgi:hypothetical protein
VIGARCTVKEGGGRFGAEGDPGTIQEIDGELVCFSDRLRGDNIQDARQTAYDEYERRLKNAWRGP